MALRNFTHKLCMFQDNFELRIENKKNVSEKRYKKYVEIWLDVSNLRPQFQKKFFSKVFFVSLLFKAQNCLEPCVKCVWHCVMPLFTPLRSNFQQQQKKSNMYSSLIWNARLAEYRVKWVGAMLFQENGLSITFTWQNEHWYTLVTGTLHWSTLWTMKSVQFIVYSIQMTVCSIQITVSWIQLPVYSLQFAV